jgi:hypothetical protein
MPGPFNIARDEITTRSIRGRSEGRSMDPGIWMADAHPDTGSVRCMKTTG